MLAACQTSARGQRKGLRSANYIDNRNVLPFLVDWACAANNDNVARRIFGISKSTLLGHARESSFECEHSAICGQGCFDLLPRGEPRRATVASRALSSVLSDLPSSNKSSQRCLKLWFGEGSLSHLFAESCVTGSIDRLQKLSADLSLQECSESEDPVRESRPILWQRPSPPLQLTRAGSSEPWCFLAPILASCKLYSKQPRPAILQVDV